MVEKWENGLPVFRQGAEDEAGHPFCLDHALRFALGRKTRARRE